MQKIIVSVSKKNDSVWRIYFYDINEDGKYYFTTKRIKNTLRIIEIALEEIEKQRLEAFLSTVRAPEKELLNKLKESLS